MDTPVQQVEQEEGAAAGTQPVEISGSESVTASSDNAAPGNHVVDNGASTASPTPKYADSSMIWEYVGEMDVDPKSHTIMQGRKNAKTNGGKVKDMMWFNGKYWEKGEHKVLEMAGEVIKMRIDAHKHAVRPIDGRDSRPLDKLESFSNESRLRGMLALTEGKLHVPATEFDANPYLLNAGNGVVDLKTGKLTPHAPEQHNTKWSPVMYDPDAVSTKWNDAVMGIACGNEELYLFLQHLAGYSASGDVSAQRLFGASGFRRDGATRKT